MASSSNTLLPTRADFASRLRALSLAVSANLSYATASGDKDSAWEALKFAAEALLSWEERAAHLFDVEWAGTIGVCLNWTTRAVVKLAPYAERLAYRAAQGP
ncbi:hypothetical protein C0991_002544, partial [Blastosporella zonata]